MDLRWKLNGHGLRQTAYLSPLLLSSAAHFAKVSAEIERDDTHVWRIHHQGYVIGSILSSIAFLEGAVNGLFSLARTSPSTCGLSADAAARIGGMWGLDSISRGKGVLDKYQLTLIANDVPPFDTGSDPFQSAKLAVDLRNALVHFVPKQVTTLVLPGEMVKEERFEKRLRGRFPLNPLAFAMSSVVYVEDEDIPPPAPVQGKIPFFPNHCLGHGCAKWVFRSSLAFADEFVSRMHTGCL